jgi:acetyl-CoA synthetase
MGVPVISYEATPTPESCLDLLQEHQITNLATVPTLLRGIMALGAQKVAAYRLALRCISCCGEPLNSEVIRFFRETLGVTPTDQFGSSENGLPLGNFNALDVEILPGFVDAGFRVGDRR